ncbi:MAG: nuclear transport factor 2 family protein [Acidobacteriia bacterium]|nr:nuclear transport factor 2 family protein [Terriglobia bacterium]
MAMKHAREWYVELAVKKYFANVDRKNLQGVLDCFNEDAVFTIQSHFSVHTGRDTGIRKMFEELFQYRTILHTDFENIVDVESEAISSRFRVELDPVSGPHVHLMNVNHWYVKNDKFQRVYVWMSGENVLK